MVHVCNQGHMCVCHSEEQRSRCRHTVRTNKEDWREVAAREEQAKAKAAFSPREEILEEAKKIVMKDRNSNYGNPEDNFKQIADLWNAYLNARRRNVGKSFGMLQDYQLQPADIAVMNMLIKIARLAKTPSHHDSAVDVAGYAACLGDIQKNMVTVPGSINTAEFMGNQLIKETAADCGQQTAAALRSQGREHF